MATLQAARSGSPFTSQSRFKLVAHKPMQRPSALPKPEAEPLQALPEPVSTPPDAPSARQRHGLTELEHRQLPLQVATLYPGWQLVSMQHRPESGVLVAHLVRATADPNQAIREGHSLQIIMDATGDLRIRHPRPKRESLLARLLRWLFAGVTGYSNSASPI